MQRLADKVAIITGAAGSIGAATVRAFADEGATVFAVDRTWEGARAEATDAVVRMSIDVTDEARIARMIDECTSRAGRIDILFNNAAIEGPRAEIPDYPLQRFLEVMNVNVVGVFLGMKYVLPVMARQRSGSIINASSLGGLRGSRAMSGYVASKHAVLGLTRTAALEWGGRGVRVNSIHPGYIDSRMLDEYLQGPGTLTREELAGKVPLGRLGSPADVARLAVFLGCDESAYVNGAAYSIDGGLGTG